MAFQIKDFLSIVASMVNHMRAIQTRITDFNVGSVARTLVEAPAVEIDELYQMMFRGLKEAIPVSIYTTFDFARLPAMPAVGLVRVTITAQATDTAIPAGKTFAYEARGTAYQSQDDATIAAGNTFADIYVTCTEAGTVGNVVAGTALQVDGINGLISAVTQTDFAVGAEEESDSERKTRFGAWIASLNRATLKAVDYGTRTARLTDANGLVTESVRSVWIREPYLEDPANQPGWIEVYVHNGVDGASVDLINRVNAVLHGYYDLDGTPIPGWKAAGVKTDVIAATTVTVDVTGALDVLTGYVEVDVAALALAEVAAYLTALEVGKNALFAEIVAAIMNVDGVYNVTLSAPVADVAIASNEKAMPGTITLT